MLPGKQTILEGMISVYLLPGSPSNWCQLLPAGTRTKRFMGLSRSPNNWCQLLTRFFFGWEGSEPYENRPQKEHRAATYSNLSTGGPSTIAATGIAGIVCRVLGSARITGSLRFIWGHGGNSGFFPATNLGGLTTCPVSKGKQVILTMAHLRPFFQESFFLENQHTLGGSLSALCLRI